MRLKDVISSYIRLRILYESKAAYSLLLCVCCESKLAMCVFKGRQHLIPIIVSIRFYYCLAHIYDGLTRYKFSFLMRRLIFQVRKLVLKRRCLELPKNSTLQMLSVRLSACFEKALNVLRNDFAFCVCSSFFLTRI